MCPVCAGGEGQLAGEAAEASAGGGGGGGAARGGGSQETAEGAGRVERSQRRPQQGGVFTQEQTEVPTTVSTEHRLHQQRICRVYEALNSVFLFILKS